MEEKINDCSQKRRQKHISVVDFWNFYEKEFKDLKNWHTENCLVLEIECTWVDHLNFNGSFDTIQYFTCTPLQLIFTIRIVGMHCFLVLNVNLLNDTFI